MQNQPFAPIQRKRTFEEVSSAIKEMIVNRAFKPGDRLPTETELSKQFKVGRQTIREALRILELSGLIAVQKGGIGGPVVKNTILDTVHSLLVDAFRLEELTIVEITQARLAIEKLVLNHAIVNCREDDIEALRKNIISAREKISQGATAVDENLAFHLLLAQASKNRIFVVVAHTIMTMLGTLLRRLGPTVAISNSAVEFHEQILEALAERNEEAAWRALENHLQEVNERLQALPEDRRNEN